MDRSTLGMILGVIVFVAVWVLNMMNVSNILIAVIVAVIALAGWVILRRIKF